MHIIGEIYACGFAGTTPDAEVTATVWDGSVRRGGAGQHGLRLCRPASIPPLASVSQFSPQPLAKQLLEVRPAIVLAAARREGIPPGRGGMVGRPVRFRYPAMGPGVKPPGPPGRPSISPPAERGRKGL